MNAVTMPRRQAALAADGDRAGAVRAARMVGVPIVVSFTVETDGSLPSGEPLGHAFERLDAQTDASAAYLMVNCAHPDHVRRAPPGDWVERVRAVRCNASRQRHVELDAAEVLDDGDPHEFASDHLALRGLLPRLSVVGGCCGSDLRHVTEEVQTLSR